MSNSLQHQQQQQQENEDYDYSDNIAAQRSAAEAISLSRSSLSMTMAQGDQIHHCNDLRLRNEYIVKKSERLIRGMTWSGWMKNLVSKDIQPIERPSKKSSSSDLNTMMMKRQHVVNENSKNRFMNHDRHGNHPNEMKDDSDNDSDNDGAFQNVPSELFNQASLITNYKSNVRLLKRCQSRTDYLACLEVCNALQKSTEQIFIQYEAQQHKQYNDNNHHQTTERGEYLREWNHKLQLKFQKTRDMHSTLVFTSEELDVKFMKQNHNDNGISRLNNNMNTNMSNRAQLFHRQKEHHKTKENNFTKSILQTANPSKYKEQEDHLDIMSNSIKELLHATTSINTVLEDQNTTMDMLNDGTDNLVESTKMVSRKVDRMRYRTMWRYPKSDYKCSVIIQHIPTQTYLTIEPHHNNKLTLYTQPHSDASIFNVYERQTPGTRSAALSSHNGNDNEIMNTNPNHHKFNMIGFCNKCTRTWLGQSSFLGSVSCSARKFGKNEEWELDDGLMERTKILCASANWGSGGWLDVNVPATNDNDGENKSRSKMENVCFSFLGYDAVSKKNASLWSVIVLCDDENDEDLI